MFVRMFQDERNVIEIHGNGTKDVLQVYINGQLVFCDFSGAPRPCEPRHSSLMILASYHIEGNVVVILSSALRSVAPGVIIRKEFKDSLVYINVLY